MQHPYFFKNTGLFTVQFTQSLPVAIAQIKAPYYYNILEPWYSFISVFMAKVSNIQN